MTTTEAQFTRKRFRLKMQFFLYGYMFRLHENGENANENTKMFSLRKRYPKWKLLKTQQTKCSVNAENANVENANAEKVFYQAWSNTKVGVDLEEPCMAEKKLALLFDTPTTSESGEYGGIYRVRHYQRKLLFVMFFASREQKRFLKRLLSFPYKW